MLLLCLLVRLGLDSHLTLLVVRVGERAQLTAVLLKRAKLVDLLALCEYPVERCFQTLLLRQTVVVGDAVEVRCVGVVVATLAVP